MTPGDLFRVKGGGLATDYLSPFIILMPGGLHARYDDDKSTEVEVWLHADEVFMFVGYVDRVVEYEDHDEHVKSALFLSRVGILIEEVNSSGKPAWPNWNDNADLIT